MNSIEGLESGHLCAFSYDALVRVPCMYLFNCLTPLFSSHTQEEQDIKALQVKNRKLGEALDQRQASLFFHSQINTH